MTQLELLRDLMLGGRHSRRTVAHAGVSLPTADRWLKELLDVVPGMRRSKVGKTSWHEWRPPGPTWVRTAKWTPRVRVAP